MSHLSKGKKSMLKFKANEQKPLSKLRIEKNMHILGKAAG